MFIQFGNGLKGLLDRVNSKWELFKASSAMRNGGVAVVRKQQQQLAYFGIGL